MSNESNYPKDDQIDENASPDQTDSAAQSPASDDGNPQLTAEQKLQQENQQLEQRLLRVSADYQNFMRRSRSEIKSACQQQIISLARELVIVLDHFDSALASSKENHSGDKFVEGMAMVRDELLNVLGRFGVKRVDAQIGEEFNPNLHEAMLRQPSDEVEANHVAAQLQSGYVLEDKTIRPVKVAVAQ